MSVIGECPYPDCHESFLLFEEPAKMPTMQKHACEKCDRVIWTRHSRVDPWSMTETDFHDTYDVNEQTKSITLKPVKPSATEPTP